MNDHERRQVNGTQRKGRVVVGSISAPLSIVISYILYELWGKPVSTELTIAISTLIGSFTSVATICFWDVRGIVLSYFYQRRLSDLRKRREQKNRR